MSSTPWQSPLRTLMLGAVLLLAAASPANAQPAPHAEAPPPPPAPDAEAPPPPPVPGGEAPPSAPQAPDAEAPPANASPAGDQANEKMVLSEDPLGSLVVTGDSTQRERVAGSAHFIDETQLEAFEYDDIHRVLLQIPGVYVRGEDGFGLRPNIGIRGANSDRSAKVTLMEDGILLGPAPYSAPAAYYFPLTTRLTGVEVFKGPAAIRHGPNTIGGAVNLITREAPYASTAFIDAAYGMNNALKLHGYGGMGEQNWGVLIEGVHLGNDGFKHLPSGADTGFNKTELMLKARFNTDPAAAVMHQLELKGGYSDEDSFETYLGLSDSDFLKDPYHRYPASQNDRMRWHRWQGELRYRLRVGQDFELTVAGYRHDFHRIWSKLNRFRGGPPIEDILRNPNVGQLQVFHSILTGEANSETAAQDLMLGSNNRRFFSEGVQALATWRLPKLWEITQTIELGARWHQDGIERLHTEDAFAMDQGQLVARREPSLVTTHNRARTEAWSFHLLDEVAWGDLLITPGVRVEVINRLLTNLSTGESIPGSNVVWLPGVGASYQITPWLGVLAGVHRGFSPVAPGQPEETQPESSINAEAGARLSWGDTRAELIGFFNAYQNLSGQCTFSSGCNEQQVDTQYNAGAVNVYGLEALLGQSWDFHGVRLSGYATYTLTLSEFQSSFTSPFPQFGDVEIGDALAYVPVHQAAWVAGVAWWQLQLDASVSYVGEMRDVAGSGPIPAEERIGDRVVVDATLSYRPFAGHRLYANFTNLLGQVAITSRRPFGARPIHPFAVQVGYQVELGS